MWNRRSSFSRMKISFRVIFCLAWISLIGPGCDQIHFPGTSKSEWYRTRAKRLYEEKDFQGVIEVYEDLIRFDPKLSEPYFKIAMIYYSNLNDNLNAAYYFKRFLQCPNPEAGTVELAKSYLENATLQFAASIPNAGGQSSPELVKLRSENDALRRQVEELKREIVHTRSKANEAANNLKPKEAKSKQAPGVAAKATTIHPRSYTVKKGEGIQSISEKIYGTKSKWREIAKANPHIKDPDKLVPGQVLFLP